MTLFHALVVITQLVLGTQPETSTASDTQRIDLTTTIDGQAYTCVVIINSQATKGGPAVLFLHGYGESGTDNRKQLTVGLPPRANAHPEQWPFVLIAPQKPVFNSEWEEHERAVLHFLKEAADRRLYDPERLAITGLSQGGHGTIMLAKVHLDRFVAAAPVCGYLRPIFNKDHERIDHPEATADTPEYADAAKKLKALPTWFWHGGSDSVVPVAESRALHEALKMIDAKTKYTELPGVDHNSWDAAYGNSELRDWFMKALRN